MSLQKVVELGDPIAVAFYSFLSLLPDGKAVNAKEVMARFSIGRNRFYRARKLLLAHSLITEEKLHDATGKHAGVRYSVPHETVFRDDENDNTVDLARSVQLYNNYNNTEHVIHEHVIHDHININNKNTSPLVQKYPYGFEQIWNCFDTHFGSKGSKSEAFKEFKKLKLTDADVNNLHAMILSEVSRKRTEREGGQWVSNFPHVCRVLKRREWETWAESSTPTTTSREVLL
mgnify:CR=1 FL=1